MALAALILAALLLISCSDEDNDVARKLGKGPLAQTEAAENATVGEPLWADQFGAERDDWAWGIVLDDSGGVYVVGETGGALPGGSGLGGTDAYLRRYSSEGDEIWTLQIGTNDFDRAWGVSKDGGGSLYVAGSTGGVMPGQAAMGDLDAFVGKYDTDGNELWIRQFGTGGFDEAFSVTVDPGGFPYVVGTTDGVLPGQTSSGFADAFMRKYSPQGNELWTQQFGDAGDDSAMGVASDATGNVYVVGEIDGMLPGQVGFGNIDAYIRKYDPEGGEMWTRQFGTRGSDSALAVTVSADGSVFLAGSTSAELPGQSYAGDADAFVRKYDSDGNELWTRQFGTEDLEEVSDLVLDGMGILFLVGFVGDALPGENFSGGRNDAYVRAYDLDGDELWTHQFGTPGRDLAAGAAVDSSGNLYVAGGTEGALPGQTNVGRADAFVVKLAGRR